MNIVSGLSDILGKAIGTTRFAKWIIPRTYTLVLLLNCMILFSYWTEFYVMHQWASLWSLVFVFLIYIRNGAATSVFTLKVTEIVDKETEEAAGSLFIYSQLLGNASGGILALIIGQVNSFVKG